MLLGRTARDHRKRVCTAVVTTAAAAAAWLSTMAATAAASRRVESVWDFPRPAQLELIDDEVTVVGSTTVL